MKWSYRIARVAGIDVRLHVTFLLLLAFFGYQAHLSGGLDAALLAVLFILLLFLCVLLHEFGHAFAARAYGIRTPDITLLPIGGVARLERMPDNPWQELVIAIAGPAVNVVIALVLWAAVGFPLHLHEIFDFDGARGMTSQLLVVNVGLVLFNLIPAFPMDGGRMLRAGLAMRIDHVTATRIAARIGQAIAVLFGLFGVWSGNLMLAFVAAFIFLGAQQEVTYANLRSAVAGLRVADAMITRFHRFLVDMSLAAAAEEALHDTQPIYVVTDLDLRVVGMLARNELLAAARTPGSVAALAVPVPTVRSDASFDEAFHHMQQSGSGVLPVVNPAGQIVGLVSLNLLRERAKMRA